MTGLRSALGRLIAGAETEVEGAPQAEFTVAPDTPQQLARLLDFACEHHLAVLPWGGGRHQGLGGRVDPDVVISTNRFAGVENWAPDDLTLVVGAGTSLREIAEVIGERGQTAVLPETEPLATVGGVVAAGVSGWQRLRYGPTRDRVLQVQAVTGDGRVISGGARVVKNVTGYDIPKLFTGSFGSLGVITSVCLKLWPSPERVAMVRTDDADEALRRVYRPYAVLESNDETRVVIGGTAAEVEAQIDAIDGRVAESVEWPVLPDGQCRISLRVAPALVAAAIEMIRPNPFVASYGVGEVRAAVAPDWIGPLREWAASHGGAVVIEDAPLAVREVVDPWGESPVMDLQRRVKSAFDPVGVMVPGRMPGGL